MRETVLLLAALVLPAAAGAQDWRGPAAIEVQVEDAKGRNLAGAEVLLVYLSPDGGGSLPSVLTDTSGKANIGGLAAGRWSAEIRHAGHMSYRAELALSADGKPVVQSASHLMAPGATATMKVKFVRGRGGAPAPAAAIEEAPVNENPPAASVAPARAPVPAVARVKAPVEEIPAPAPAPVAPAPATVPATAIEEAPVKEMPPAAAVAPAPALVPASPAAKAPVKDVPPMVQPPAVPAQPSPAAPAPSPARTPPPATPPPAAPPAAPPTALAAAPAVAPVDVVPAAPSAPPAAPAAARPRLCVECPAGESAEWGEAAIPGGAAAGCPADLAEKLKSVELGAVAQLSADLAAAGAGCRVIAVELPAGARFTGYRYEAQSAGVAADCLPGRGCPAGDCRFPADPVLRQVGNKTVLLVPFESTAADLRRAVVAGYSTYNKR
ncbi:MAG: carboxypeptidase-like regulatory domain-containing protein [Thermoanaerobaculia bacterium]